MEEKGHRGCPTIPMIFYIQTVVHALTFHSDHPNKTSLGTEMGNLTHGKGFSIPTVGN